MRWIVNLSKTITSVYEKSWLFGSWVLKGIIKKTRKIILKGKFDRSLFFQNLHLILNWLTMINCLENRFACRLIDDLKYDRYETGGRRLKG